jgi:hypothetical protein
MIVNDSRSIAEQRDGGKVTMTDMTRRNGIVLTTALARLDAQIWAKRTIREAVSIAARAAKKSSKAPVDPECVDAVLTMVVEQIEAERRALGHLSG